MCSCHLLSHPTPKMMMMDAGPDPSGRQDMPEHVCSAIKFVETEAQRYGCIYQVGKNLLSDEWEIHGYVTSTESTMCAPSPVEELGLRVVWHLRNGTRVTVVNGVRTTSSSLTPTANNDDEPGEPLAADRRDFIYGVIQRNPAILMAPNVSMVYPSSQKWTGGQPTNCECIRIYVWTKGVVPAGCAAFPTHIEGIPIDVLDCGPIIMDFAGDLRVCPRETHKTCCVCT